MKKTLARTLFACLCSGLMLGAGVSHAQSDDSDQNDRSYEYRDNNDGQDRDQSYDSLGYNQDDDDDSRSRNDRSRNDDSAVSDYGSDDYGYDSDNDRSRSRSDRDRSWGDQDRDRRRMDRRDDDRSDRWGDSTRRRGSDSAESGALGVLIETRNDGQLRVRRVFQDSPARNAGLQQGDVIRSIDGERFTSARQLAQAVRNMDPGQSVRLQVKRDGETRRYTVKLDERQEVFDNLRRDRRGLGYASSDRRYYRGDSQVQGLREDLRELQRELNQLEQRLDGMRGRSGSQSDSRRSSQYDRSRGAYDQYRSYDSRSYDDGRRSGARSMYYQGRRVYGQGRRMIEGRGFRSTDDRDPYGDSFAGRSDRDWRD